LRARGADSAVPALLAFAGLLAFASLHWASLLADPPIGRALAAALVIVAGAAALLVSGARLRGATAVATWGAVGLLTAALAGLAAGLPAELLAPARWDQLGANLGDGLARIGDAEYPFAGGDEWARLVILLGLPLTGTVAALLAFRPGRPGAGPAIAGLVVLVGAFAVAAAINPHSAPLLHGLVLFALVAAWLWLPRVRRGSMLAAAALVAIAGFVVLAPAARLDAADPWLDYSEWAWERGDDPESFLWDHSYGPIDWPRSGDVVLEVESESPHYWRAAVLDEFDGYRWRIDDEPGATRHDLPAEVEGEAAVGGLDPAWTDRIDFRVASLESRFVVGAGSVIALRGIGGAEPTAAGVLLTDRRPLREDDAYSVLAYAPSPTDRQMRAAAGPYPQSLRPYTEIALPVGENLILHRQVALRGGERNPGSAVGPIFDGSPYRGLHRLARRLSAGAPTTFDAVEAIATHLRESYDYSETPPRRRYPLRAFLFRDRIGYCQQFSGAMALMLRSLGIPARVASGFSPGTPTGGGFSVSDLDAHSWVEVYFNGVGWVAFDPTPAAAPASSRLARPGAPLTIDRPGRQGVAGDARDRTGAVSPATGTGGGGVPAWLAPLAILLALALAGAAAVFSLRRRRTRGLPPGQLADAQVRELRAALRRLRRPLPAGITLLALEQRVGSARRDAIAAYAAKLRAARYARGFRPPGPGDRAAARRELSSGGGLARRLRGWRAFPPGGPSH